MPTITELDAHEQPTAELRAKWKSWSRMDAKEVMNHPRIDDPRKPPVESGFTQTGTITKEQRRDAFSQFVEEFADEAKDDVPVLHHPLLPGLLVVPSLVPPAVQVAALERMLHRDLCNPTHQTNLHLHYDLPYPHHGDGDGATTPVSERSLFALSPTSGAAPFLPKDPSVHKPLTARQVLTRRLHWVTLGGQYDWTSRVYPEEEQAAQRLPAFPTDIARFLAALFPATDAQAAIVNLYSPGDTMMMHRDVSEFTDRGLVSLSFGCDGLFMIAPNTPSAAGSEGRADGDEEDYLLLRLRSGDAIYMTQESRFAWHGVPKIIPGTCPSYLESWPAREDGQFAAWEGWMKSKRVNLNVRQVRE
ncbi:oxidoreductase, 2OG-Fe(II) oxygenase family [Cordyceps fumosorosea ARSEF 2679]|uniref:mRNA N(6)-methyladenine demethylase n=1 Tax=Cordyceps fumosorosea (strain ARSEF 2679) TaxID=1081104 RepID=A0A168AR60_CORFA|nr:oxidoreductase, 2OG-Fe(II) oxygenase family [Cordyceps fumosorosea ARSEF 2679]OAA69085.1 oxidoreductase, 2OG-Fe(II) oxygenase family [Cordyceps fumosorosea ARSEF 2679]